MPIAFAAHLGKPILVPPDPELLGAFGVALMALAKHAEGSLAKERPFELDDLIKLDCDPAEGFVLSRITGKYTIEEVLNLLPGSDLNNRVIIHNLIRRGLVKHREFTSVRRFQPPAP